MRGEILGYVKCDISADLKRDNHSWWGLKRESPRVSALSELMWACYCLDYKRGELTAIIEKDHFGLICSDNNKGSSNNLSSKAQSSSIRHRLGTQSEWIHFTCFVFFFLGCCAWRWEAPGDRLPEFLWGSYPSATPPENRSDSSYPTEALSEEVVD